MLFAHITREADVPTFTGIEGPEMFKAIFEMLKPKTNYNLDPQLLPISNDGPARELSLEQEVLLININEN